MVTKTRETLAKERGNDTMSDFVCLALFGICAVVPAACAQASLEGVSLGGTVSAPVIVNNSSHRVLEYTLLFQGPKGPSRPSTYSMLPQLRKEPLSSVGIAPGTSWTHPTNAFVQVLDASGQPSVASVTNVVLDSVLFEDGRPVGPDKAGHYEMLILSLQAERDAHEILTTATDVAHAWTVLENIASGQTKPPRDPSQSEKDWIFYSQVYRTRATELVQVRSKLGDAAAMDLARAYVFSPKIVKVD
jgi:hypothetical protein